MNVMDEYLKIIHEDLSTSLKQILEKKYKKNIVDEFVNTYIFTRYYNEDAKMNLNTIKQNIIKKLTQKEKELYKKYPEKEKWIKVISEYVYLILYIDNISEIDSKEIINVINKYEDKDKAVVMLEDLKSKHDIKKEMFINSLDSEDFYLEYEDCNRVNNVQMVTIDHNIEFSMIYSEFAIQKAFDTGKIYEDRYLVAYHLLAQQIIKDMNDEIFNQKYIINFPETILDRKQKYKKLIEIISNDIIKEKMCLVINYEDFLNNKNEYNSLINKGFGFAIRLKNKVSKTAAMKMEIFRYIIINKELKYYTELRKTNKKLKIIEIWLIPEGSKNGNFY